MRLQVTKLFGEKDFDITLNNDINILIGQNGSGKSTILKILNYIFRDNLFELSKIDFEEIHLNIPINDYELFEYIDGKINKINDINISISRDDIIPLHYVKDDKFKIIFRSFLEEYDYYFDIENVQLNFANFMKSFHEKFEREKSGIAETNVYDKVNFDEDIRLYLGWDDSYITDVTKNYGVNFQECSFQEALACMYSQKRLNYPYGCKLYFYNLYLMYITKSLIDKYKIPSENVKKRLILENGKIGFLLTSLSGTFTNVHYISNESFDFSKFYDCYFIKRNGEISIIMDKIDYELAGNDKRKILLMHQSFNQNLELAFNIFYKTFYDDYVIFREQKKYKKDLMTYQSFVKLVKYLSNPINISNIRKNILCPLIEFEKDAIDLEKYKMVMNYIKIYRKYSFDKKDMTQEDYSFIIQELEKKFNDDHSSISKLSDDHFFISELKNMQEKNYTREQYILDVLSDTNIGIVYFNKDGKLDDINAEKWIRDTLFSASDMFQKVVNLNFVEYQDSVEALNFYKLVNKYFINKYFVLSHDEDGYITVDIFDKRNNMPIKEEMLSSGEYKMLRIIKMIAFSDELSINILDEPELSLSIYWQSMLVDDLLKYSKKGFTIIATQSPHLIGEDKVKYLVEIKSNE